MPKPPRAKLSAGRGWPSLLGGQRSRPGPARRGDLSQLSGNGLRKAADRKVSLMEDAMHESDYQRARANLRETMYLLRRARALPGDMERRTRMRSVVGWLGAR